MSHRASTSPVCIWSEWYRENVVAPEGIIVMELVVYWTLPGASGRTGEKDTFVSTSVAAAGGAPVRRNREVRNRIATTMRRTGDLPGKDIPVQVFASVYG